MWARELYFRGHPEIYQTLYVCDNHKHCLENEATTCDDWFSARCDRPIYPASDDNQCVNCWYSPCPITQWKYVGQIIVNSTRKPVLYLSNRLSPTILRFKPNKLLLNECERTTKLNQLLERTRNICIIRHKDPWINFREIHQPLLYPVWWNAVGALYLSDDIREIKRSTEFLSRCDICDQMFRVYHSQRKPEYLQKHCYQCYIAITQATNVLKTTTKSFPMWLLDGWTQAVQRKNRVELLRAKYILEELWPTIITK